MDKEKLYDTILILETSWFQKFNFQNDKGSSMESVTLAANSVQIISATAQCPEIDFDKISNIIHKTYIGWTSMRQGFQKCIAWNPSKQGMEGPR